MQAYAYELGPFTAEQFRTLEWCEARGYTGNAIAHSDYMNDDDPNAVTLHFSEASAWKVQEEAEVDPHAFGTCCTGEVVVMLHQFLDSIV